MQVRGAEHSSFSPTDQRRELKPIASAHSGRRRAAALEYELVSSTCDRCQHVKLCKSCTFPRKQSRIPREPRTGFSGVVQRVTVFGRSRTRRCFWDVSAAWENGIDMNSSWGGTPFCSGFDMRRSPEECLAQKLHDRQMWMGQLDNGRMDQRAR